MTSTHQPRNIKKHRIQFNVFFAKFILPQARWALGGLVGTTFSVEVGFWGVFWSSGGISRLKIKINLYCKNYGTSILNPLALACFFVVILCPEFFPGFLQPKHFESIRTHSLKSAQWFVFFIPTGERVNLGLHSPFRQRYS